MSNCLFCGIAAGTVAADIVLSDNVLIAFRDINPQAPTHMLIVPRSHIASVTDVTEGDDGLWCRLLHAAQQLAAGEGVNRSGYRLVVNAGSDGGQTVHHLHLHLIGGRRLGWPPG